ncbi:MAG: 2-oxoglutarate dehydrogenase E2 component (dihydrolipoamide succinyltransferase) [Spirosomataceae bacterium]|jgi:2-oxoglutarate dehydrogenase E2 component (dihydrolipoamide succinyltransferase)
MKIVEMTMPPMGESIFECTVLNWLVKEGDNVTEDDMVIEVATDKIDTEIGSSMSGKITKFLVQEGDVAIVGKPICLVEVAGNAKNGQEQKDDKVNPVDNFKSTEIAKDIEEQVGLITTSVNENKKSTDESQRFYSPLVLNIANEENISRQVLDTVTGSGKDGRVTKNDILNFVQSQNIVSTPTPKVIEVAKPVTSVALSDEIIEMTRMRKVIAERMVSSKRTAPHVTSFVEVDMTEVVEWRNKVKSSFQKKNGEKITFTPILIQAIVQAIQKFPMINIQVDGDSIIKKKDINIGMAVALPDGNLIVPIIKNADSYSLVGLTKKVNDLAERARLNQLKPDELTGGTYTISNIGGFGNLSGTPIIVQPQVAIMAFGVILKKPAVVETPAGDFIGIRHKMIISHSYDHRVVDGSLGGLFAKEVADNLENFETEKTNY